MAKLSKAQKKYLKQLKKDIKNHGRRVTCVMGDETSTGFTYSVGNTLKGIPEMISFYPSFENAADVINTLSEMMIHDEIDLSNDISFVDDILPSEVQVEVRRIDHNSIQYEKLKDDYMCAVKLLTRKPDIIQVVIPDPNGLYPDHHKCMKQVKEWTPILFK